MTDKIEEFFVRLNRLYSEERYTEIQEVISEPLPVYAENGLQIMATRQDAQTALSKMLRKARAAGSVMFAHQILSIRESARGDSTAVFVRWYYLGSDAEELDTSEVNYFLGKNLQGDLRIILVEYQKLAFSGYRAGRGRDVDHSRRKLRIN